MKSGTYNEKENRFVLFLKKKKQEKSTKSIVTLLAPTERRTVDIETTPKGDRLITETKYKLIRKDK
jgi:hypothetical protein